MNEYEEKLLGSNNPHWMLSYIKSQQTAYVKVFINAIINCDSKTCNYALKRFLDANEMLR